MTTILRLEQGSEEWHQARIGSIGGGSIAQATAGGKGATRELLLYIKASEIITGQKYSGYSNDAMRLGIEREPDARLLYEIMTGLSVDSTVGLYKGSEYTHYSPDGVLEDRIIEIKSPSPPNPWKEVKAHTHLEVLKKSKVPSQYVKQCQWGLYICEKERLDFISYFPEFVIKPLLIVPVYREEKLIAELKDGADKFVAEMLKLVEGLNDTGL